MLVVEGFDTTQSKRMRCSVLSQRLKGLEQMCEADRDYAVKANPWNRNSMTASPLVQPTVVILPGARATRDQLGITILPDAGISSTYIQ